jgi:hypothetical protein
MKGDLVYPYYLIYLDSRLCEGRLSKGSLSLLKISKSAFEDFKYKFDNDELFNSKIIELYKSEMRDKKIDDLFDDIN